MRAALAAATSRAEGAGCARSLGLPGDAFSSVLWSRSITPVSACATDLLGVCIAGQGWCDHQQATAAAPGQSCTQLHGAPAPRSTAHSLLQGRVHRAGGVLGADEAACGPSWLRTQVLAFRTHARRWRGTTVAPTCSVTSSLTNTLSFTCCVCGRLNNTRLARPAQARKAHRAPRRQDPPIVVGAARRDVWRTHTAAACISISYGAPLMARALAAVALRVAPMHDRPG